MIALIKYFFEIVNRLFIAEICLLKKNKELKIFQFGECSSNTQGKPFEKKEIHFGECWPRNSVVRGSK